MTQSALLTAKQYQYYTRSQYWWIGYAMTLIILVVGTVFSYQTSDPGRELSVGMIVNCCMIMLLFGVYWVVVINTNPQLTVTIDHDGMLTRGDQPRINASDYTAWSVLTGKGQDHETIVFLDEGGHIAEQIILSPTTLTIPDGFRRVLDYVLPFAETFDLRRYERLQYILKI